MATQNNIRKVKPSDVEKLVMACEEDIVLSFMRKCWPNDDIPKKEWEAIEWLYYEKFEHEVSEGVWQFWADLANSTPYLNNEFWRAVEVNGKEDND